MTTISARILDRAVWERVAQQKAIAKMRLGSASTTSSLNEALESPQVKKVCDACAKALNDLVTKMAELNIKIGDLRNQIENSKIAN